MVPSLLLTALIGTLSSENGDEVVLDEIVARVNHEIIALTDWNKQLDYLKRSLEEEVQNPESREKEFQQQKSGLLKQMIEEKLMLQFAEELGFTANIEVDVAAYLEEFREKAGIPNMEVFDQLLRQRGSSLAEFRKGQRKLFIIRSLVGQMVYSKIILLTPEIEAYYQKNLDRFTLLPEVELAEILFLTEGKNSAEVREKAERVLAELEQGAEFEELAKQYSDGPTAPKGGHIGNLKKGSITPALEQLVFDLEPGQTTGIVEMEFGLQIVKLLSKKGTRHTPLEDVHDQIKEELYQKRAEPQLKAFRQELRRKAYVYVSPKYRDQYQPPESEPAAEVVTSEP